MGSKMTGGLLLGISMVFLSVGFMMFGQVTDAAGTILAYAYSANASMNVTAGTYTGLAPIVGVTPLLVLLGFICASLLTGFMGVQIIRGASEGELTPGRVLIMSIGLIFFSVGLRIFPVLLDGVSYIIHGGGHGINPTFTGLAPIMAMVPMLAILVFVAATVLSEYFGIKKIGSSNGQ